MFLYLFKTEGILKTKQLLRFYFYAEGAERAIDNLIMYIACSPFGDGGAERAAQKIIKLRDCKDSLAELWGYLDGVISRLGAERDVLLGYVSGERAGDERRQKRVLMRFRRRASGVERFDDALALLRKYIVYCRE